jgi:hypothetical protein
MRFAVRNQTTFVICLHLLIVCKLASGSTVATDDASQPAYSDGWQATDDGGTGFGPWTFAYSGITATLLYPPQFIDRAPLPANSLGVPAFALTTSNRPTFTDTSEVHRTFDVPLAIGQTLSVDVDGSRLDPTAIANTIGNTIDLFGTNSSKRFSLFTNNQYFSDHWTAPGNADTGIPAENAFHLDVTLLTADTYNLVLSPIEGGTPFFTQMGAPLAETSGAAIHRIRLSTYGTGSSADGSQEFFFNNLSISSPDGSGDFNQDNLIDAADYVVWRKNSMSAEDENIWRMNFGETAPGSGAITGTVPEPANLLSVQLLLVIYAAFVRRVRGQS